MKHRSFIHYPSTLKLNQILFEDTPFHFQVVIFQRLFGITFDLSIYLSIYLLNRFPFQETNFHMVIFQNGLGLNNICVCVCVFTQIVQKVLSFTKKEERQLNTFQFIVTGGAPGELVHIVGNGLGDSSSNSGIDSLYLTQRSYPWKSPWIQLFFLQLWMNRRTEWAR